MLVEARIRRFRSIHDSLFLPIRDDVTCLIGRNGVGKTSILEALHRSRPVDAAEGSSFCVRTDYPFQRREELTAPGDLGSRVEVTSLRYRLEVSDLDVLASTAGGLESGTGSVTITHHYGRHEERWAVGPAECAGSLPFESRPGPSVAPESVDVRPSVVLPSSNPVRRSLEGRVPRFEYVGADDSIPDSVCLADLLGAAPGSGRGVHRALSGLLEVSGIEVGDLVVRHLRDRAVRRLQRAAHGVTSQIVVRWPELAGSAVLVDVAEDRDGAASVLRFRFRDATSGVVTRLSAGPRGVPWLFALLCRLRAADVRGPRRVLLLDEPGVGLDAVRQADLGSFLEEVSNRHQVVFSTQAPQLAGAVPLEGVRAVEDLSGGTVVTVDALRAEADTVRPLAGAIAARLSRTLFASDNLLLVGEVSDCIYLQFLSGLLRSKGREGLDERWSLVPAGGATSLPLFLSLFGGQRLRAVPLLDSRSSPLATMRPVGLPPRTSTSTSVSVAQVLGRADADVEDLFTDAFYLDLVNRAYGSVMRKVPVSVDDLPQTGRLVQRVEEALRRRWITGRIDRLAPASVLLQREPVLTRTVDALTLERAQNLCTTVNLTLP